MTRVRWTGARVSARDEIASRSSEELRRAAFVLGVALLLAGCFAAHAPAGDAGPSPPRCGDGVCNVLESCFGCAADCGAPVRRTGPAIVDIVLVVDNSGGVLEQQLILSLAIPRLLDSLVNPPIDASGLPVYPPVTDIHAGVLSTDIGAGPYHEFCGAPDDGLFIDRYRVGPSSFAYDPTCPTAFPRFLSWSAATGAGYALGDLAHDLGCLTILGTSGCGFEQPLESLHRALTVHLGAGDGLNNIPGNDFLRRDSLLVIVMQSDENDCSIADYTLIDPSRADLGYMNLRCFNHPEYLYPLSRYQEGLVTEVVPEHRLDRVVIADIGGIPADLAGMDPAIVLADPRTAERIGPFSQELVPGCENRWVAYPPPRRIEMVEPFYASGNATVQTTCTDDLSGAADAAAALVRERLKWGCP